MRGGGGGDYFVPGVLGLRGSEIKKTAHRGHCGCPGCGCAVCVRWGAVTVFVV
jgi:hypothetical protein